MVEEMMLLANCTVAEHILNHFPACALLRKHAVPPPRQFEPLLRAAAACDMQLDVTSSKVWFSVILVFSLGRLPHEVFYEVNRAEIRSTPMLFSRISLIGEAQHYAYSGLRVLSSFILC